MFTFLLFFLFYLQVETKENQFMQFSVIRVHLKYKDFFTKELFSGIKKQTDLISSYTSLEGSTSVFVLSRFVKVNY